MNNTLQLLKCTKPKKRKECFRCYCPFVEEHHGRVASFDNEDSLIRHINSSHSTHSSKKAVKKLIRAIVDARKIGVI